MHGSFNWFCLMSLMLPILRFDFEDSASFKETVALDETLLVLILAFELIDEDSLDV